LAFRIQTSNGMQNELTKHGYKPIMHRKPTAEVY